MSVYKILNIEINTKNEIFDKINFYPISSLNKAALVFNISPIDSFMHFSYGISYLLKDIKGQIFFSRNYREIAMLREKEDWTQFNIYAQERDKQAIQEMVLVGFYSYVSLRQTLFLHASAIDYNGKSVVYTASSGTGKTTQAELWMKHRGAKILNGDKVFLKQEADTIHAWGSPWTGSSPYGLNSSAPLEAIIILKQAKENSIRRLDTLEAMAEFLPNVFFPRWDERCEQGVLDFLDKVMSETKFYLLSCRPDEEAVEITEKAIFGDGLRKEN